MALAWVVAALVPAAVAADGVRVFTDVHTSSRAIESLEGARGTRAVRVDASAIARFRAARGGRLEVPLAGGESVQLELRAFDPFAPGAVVTTTGDGGPSRYTADLTLFKGEVVGAPGSSAVLSLSPRGALGTIAWNGRRVGIGPVRGEAGRADPTLHLVGDARAIAHPDFHCAADELADRARLTLEGLDPRLDRTRFTPLSNARLWCDLAVDCDYEYYATRFGGNLADAIDYAITLIGVTSAIYENEINVSIRISYLNVWTTSSDPYTASTTQSELPEFRNYWQTAHPEVSRHIAHLLSGRPLGGGIAWLTTLCDRNMGYAVSQVDGFYQYPTASTTWDAYVLAHEIGHNFSSQHTQSCFWQIAGFVPPGALLDSCYTSEGGCYTGPVGMVPANRGTIMSYCHTLGPINSTIRLEFHDACKTVMRAHAEQCLPDGAFDPAVALAGAATGSTVTLTWSPSPATGVVRYDVYRSAASLDHNPALAGSTTGTSFADPGRVGTFYYRVRAVRAGDQSAPSNEARVEACTQSATDYYDAGAFAMDPIVADWNRDGILDLAVANHVPSGTVSMVLGQGAGGVGDGTFGPPAAFAAGIKASAVATADFNEDGILDLAVTNDAAAGSYSVLLGTGTAGIWNGSFAAPASYSVGSLPVAIMTGDFDENGITDLAITCSGSSTVAIALGQGNNGIGDGTFAPAANLVVGSGPAALATGDFDEDGITDIAVVRSTTGTLSLYRGLGVAGRGNGTFMAGPGYAAGSGAASVATGDFNEDGITDLAVARRESPGSVSVLLGRGTSGVGGGTFWPRVDYPAGNAPAGIVVGDFNGDGIADLAVVNAEASGAATFLFGKGAPPVGDGTFEAPLAVTMGALPSSLVASDFDEDGSADLAVAHTANPLNLSARLAGCTGSAATDLVLLAPNGGETWAATTEHTLAWHRSSGVLAVKIELSRDDGAHWETVAEGVTDTTLSWTVTDPATSGAHARVRVHDATVPQRADASDQLFTIGPNPLLAAPASGPPTLALSRVFPNPTRAGLFVSFSLPGAGAATLELVDVAGRRVATRAVGALGTGPHVVDLGSHATLASGLYFVRLTHSGRTLVARAAVIR